MSVKNENVTGLDSYVLHDVLEENEGLERAIPEAKELDCVTIER